MSSGSGSCAGAAVFNAAVAAEVGSAAAAGEAVGLLLSSSSSSGMCVELRRV